MIRKVIHFFGLARSGNHAILHWLRHDFALSGWHTVFYNFVNRRPTDQAWVGGNKDWRQFDPNNYRAFAEDFGPYVAYPRPAQLLTIFSFEDLPLDSVSQPPLHNASHFGDELAQIILIRDPYNYYASRYASATAGNSAIDPIQQRELWKSYAREAIFDTNYLTNKLPIYFHDWVTSLPYRRQLATTLGFTLHDDMHRVVAREGGGSFFSDRAVLQRWRHCMRSPDYRAFFDDEVRQLGKRVYPQQKID